MKRLCAWGFAVFAVGFLAVAPASAALVTFSSACGGTPDTCTNAGFDAAIGVPDESTLFVVDKDGNPLPGGLTLQQGNIFMDLAVFSTGPSAFNPAGSSQVLYAGAGTGTSGIGPTPGFDGILRMDFAAGVSAVGFTMVLLSPLEAIRVYDTSLALLATFPGGPSGNLDFFGVVGTLGTVIGRVELEGEFYAVENVKLDAAVVPEPGLVALMALGAAGWVARRRRLASQT